MSLFSKSVNSADTVLIWKDPVANFAAIATTYLNPDINWGVKVLDTQKWYRWNGISWEYVVYSALDDVVVSPTTPSTGVLWIDSSS